MNEQYRFRPAGGSIAVPRDIFAGFAMIGFLMQRSNDDDEDRTFEFIAGASYRMADAMLAARHDLEDAPD